MTKKNIFEVLKKIGKGMNDNDSRGNAGGGSKPKGTKGGKPCGGCGGK